MTTYRLCLRGPTGRIAKVRRYWASTDEGAAARARELLAEDPTLIGFELWDGSATSPRSGGGRVLVGTTGAEPARNRTGPIVGAIGPAFDLSEVSAAQSTPGVQGVLP